MPWFDFFWTAEIVEHLGLHGVSPAEFEDIVEHARSVSVSRTSERYVARGTTSAGRWLVCVFEMIDDCTVLPVTAFEPDEG